MRMRWNLFLGKRILRNTALLSGLFYAFLFSRLIIPHSVHAADSLQKEVGSGYCKRCHEGLFRNWQSDTKKVSCESCHGAGLNHVLAPTPRNIVIPANTSSGHAKMVTAPLPLPETRLTLDLFVMSYCPYGIAALNTLIPLIRKWGDKIELNLYFIAHRRTEKKEIKPVTSDLPPLSQKCETNGAVLDGTDAYVSLHGLPEVLEDFRQIIIAYRFKNRLWNYLSERNKDIEGDWKKAAKQARFSDSEIAKIEEESDSRLADSLLEVSIEASEKRSVSGSPTLFINGREYTEAVSAYPVERHFCQEAPKSGPCQSFPACGFDFDCTKPGMEGTCLNPMKKNARCEFKPAAKFTVSVINDEACPTCHTGNIIVEVLRRFPGAEFKFIPLDSDSGRLLQKRYSLETYPAFIFDSTALKSEKFKAIQHTFNRIHDRFVLKNEIIKSYHFSNRPFKTNELAIFGSFQNPPFVEMLRSIKDLLPDSLKTTAISLHPFMIRRSKPDSSGPWYSAFDAPYGIDEVRAGVNQRCVLSLYPIKQAVNYMICRGFDVQNRFEQKLPEPRNEWHDCALKWKIDTTKISACEHGSLGKALIEESLSLEDQIHLEDPDPVFLLNNTFRITGYNPGIRKVILKELRSK